MHHPFTFFGEWFHVGHDTLHVVTAITMGTLLALTTSVLYFTKTRVATQYTLPDRHFSVAHFFDLLVETLAGLCDEVIGHGGRKYLPFVGSVFLFILSCNLIGLVPGFLPATENWATGAAVATVVFLAFNYFGFREHGIKYLGHFLAPVSLKGAPKILAVFLVAPFLAFQMAFSGIELVSMCLRPITLSIRLFVNINADHMVLSIFSGMVPYVVPAVFMLLGLLVCVIQAFVFTLLSMVYISLAVAHEH